MLFWVQLLIKVTCLSRIYIFLFLIHTNSQKEKPERAIVSTILITVEELFEISCVDTLIKIAEKWDNFLFKVVYLDDIFISIFNKRKKDEIKFKISIRSRTFTAYHFSHFSVSFFCVNLFHQSIFIRFFFVLEHVKNKIKIIFFLFKMNEYLRKKEKKICEMWSYTIVTKFIYLYIRSSSLLN